MNTANLSKPSFKVSKEDALIIHQIAKRAAEYDIKACAHHRSQRVPRTLLDFDMDITATHANGCALDLRKLLNMDDFNFGHDIYGIMEHLNHETGELEDHFLPRCSLPHAPLNNSVSLANTEQRFALLCDRLVMGNLGPVQITKLRKALRGLMWEANTTYYVMKGNTGASTGRYAQTSMGSPPPESRYVLIERNLEKLFNEAQFTDLKIIITKKNLPIIMQVIETTRLALVESRVEV